MNTDLLSPVSGEVNFANLVHSLQLNRVDKTSQGLLYEMAQAHYSKRGKQVRPKSLYGIAQFMAVPDARLAPWAACCEMLHNATLIHDDLQGGDQVRRGQPSVLSLIHI